MPPSLPILFPHFDHPAVEERYASWQTQMLLKRGEEMGPIVFYDPAEAARDVVADVEGEHVLVVTDPLLLPSARVGVRLREALQRSGVAAAVPVANESAHPGQRRATLTPYLTLRELQGAMAELETLPDNPGRVVWDGSDPGLYVCAAELLEKTRGPLRSALEGREVIISRTDFVHRWSSLRGQTRHDLLDLIATDAKSVLEFGCGEAPLGAALKQRQKVRVVGIELDPNAAAVAKKRIDAVYLGDVREIVAILDERFDWIIGGDIVEHLDEPWSFLADLRRLAMPGGRLLLSIPNIANSSVVLDLLRGRFDYAYMGLTCVGHLRFFTRQSLQDMLTIAGWSVERIAPQDLGPTTARAELLGALDAAGLEYSRDDLLPAGYYVIARNE